MLVAVDGGVKVVFEGEGRALCVASGGFYRPSASVRPVNLLRVRQRVEPLHDALSPYPIELPVERWGLADEVVGEVGSPEVFEINRAEAAA